VAVVVRQADRGAVAQVAIVAACAGVLVYASLDLSVGAVGLAAGVIALLAIGHRLLLSWQFLLASLILVILFIPIRRYRIPGDLPFELEPYRLLVAAIAAGWLASLLTDPRIRFRRSGLETPLAVFFIAVLASLVVNSGRISASGLGSEVLKALMFFASYIVVILLIVSVTKTPAEAHRLTKILVVGGAALAIFAAIENRTGYNPFDHLAELVPVLQLDQTVDVPERGERLRSYASAQHPIALGAALVMLLPLAVYLARRSPRWWAAAALLLIGALATQSRTAVVMLGAVSLVFLWLRFKETRRFWPALVPAVLIIHLALPATLGPLKDSFFPAGGLIEEQRSSEGTRSQGRIADLSPALSEFSRQPLTGQGYGTRVVRGDQRAALEILDNQWLALLLETGVAGVLSLLWVFGRFIRRAGREGRHDRSDRGWLLAAITAAVASYAVGMLTFDAFAFVQVTFLAFMLIGLGSALLLTPRDRSARKRSSAAAV
jgi:hypothetical protein